MNIKILLYLNYGFLLILAFSLIPECNAEIVNWSVKTFTPNKDKDFIEKQLYKRIPAKTPPGKYNKSKYDDHWGKPSKWRKAELFFKKLERKFKNIGRPNNVEKYKMPHQKFTNYENTPKKVKMAIFDPGGGIIDGKTTEAEVFLHSFKSSINPKNVTLK